MPEKDKAKHEKASSTSTTEKQAVTENSVPAATNAETAAIDVEFEYYTVRNGDNIWNIAQKYVGISSDDIIKINNISNEKGLVVGQKLKIPKKS